MASQCSHLLLLFLLFPPAITSTPSHQTHSQSNSSLHLPIFNRDSIYPSSNLTPSSLFLRRLDRDAARVDSLNALLALSLHSSRSFNSPIIASSLPNSGQYFTRIAIGTPPTQYLFYLDTGSDVTWLQCVPCRGCYNQTPPIFNPQRSRSYRSVPCSDPFCRHLDMPGCDNHRETCLYNVTYLDGSVTAGDLAMETLTFSSSTTIDHVAVGCDHYSNEVRFEEAAAGILGLGGGPLSFPSQMACRYGRQFSYCLTDQTRAGELSRSSIHFGVESVPSSIIYT